jgi:hypothetical protein
MQKNKPFNKAYKIFIGLAVLILIKGTPSGDPQLKKAMNLILIFLSIMAGLSYWISSKYESNITT